MIKWFRCLLMIALLFAFSLCLFPHLTTSFKPDQTNAELALFGPNLTHWLGTDELGRDLFARLLQASKYSLSIALTATGVAAFLGFFIGALGALGGRFVHALILRIIDLFLGIPDLLIYIILGIFLGQTPFGLIIALSLFGWMSLARLVCFSIQEELSKDYLVAAKMMGTSPVNLLIGHILPNIQPVFLKAVILKIPSFILAEATLSFLGLGLKSPLASLGTMAAEGYAALRYYPHLTITPLVTIVFFMLALSLFANE